MAFLRSYAQQHAGDIVTLRAGVLRRRGIARSARGTFGRVGIAGQLAGRHVPLRARRRFMDFAGDPWKFKFKLPKAVRKLTLGKAIKGVTKLAAVAAPFVPLAGAIAPGIVGKVASMGGSIGKKLAALPGAGIVRELAPVLMAPEPSTEMPELLDAPVLQGPPSTVGRVQAEQDYDDEPDDEYDDELDDAPFIEDDDDDEYEEEDY